MLATTLTAGTVSAAPNLSSEDPEINAVWEFFLPFLNGQSDAQKTEIQNKLVDLVNTQVEKFDYDDEDYDHADFEDYDFATEKSLIIKDLKEELVEMENGDLKTGLAADIKTLESIVDEDKFFDALDTAYEKLGDFDGDFDDQDFDYSTEKESILVELTEELAELEGTEDQAGLTKELANLKTLDGQNFNEGVEKLYDRLDEIWDTNFGDQDYDDEYGPTECDFGHHGYDDFDFDDEDHDEEEEPHFRFDDDELEETDKR